VNNVVHTGVNGYHMQCEVRVHNNVNEEVYVEVGGYIYGSM